LPIRVASSILIWWVIARPFHAPPTAVIRAIDIHRVDGGLVRELGQVNDPRSFDADLLKIFVGDNDIPSPLELVAFDDLSIFDLSVARRAPPLLANARLAFAVELVEADGCRVLRCGTYFDRNTDEADTLWLDLCSLIAIMRNTTLTDAQALQKDPDDWKTADEPMTAAQRSYLETLAREAGETFDEELTKGEASQRIDELRQKSPRLKEHDER
jgi:hypothetical protein